MRWTQMLVLSSCLLLLLQACNGLPKQWHRHGCIAHPEPAFVIPTDGGPTVGLVFGTVDFDDKGAALIKIQIEDLGAIGGDEATITGWSGNGTAPANVASIPGSGSAQFYVSPADARLSHWTTHIARNFEVAEDAYWVVVRVNHNTGSGRDVRHLFFQWTPSSQTGYDTPHDFGMY